MIKKHCTVCHQNFDYCEDCQKFVTHVCGISLNPILYGYTCNNCKMWVAWGVTHVCYYYTPNIFSNTISNGCSVCGHWIVTGMTHVCNNSLDLI